MLVMKNDVPIPAPYYGELQFKTLQQAKNAFKTLPREITEVRAYLDCSLMVIGLGARDDATVKKFINRLKGLGGKEVGSI